MSILNSDKNLEIQMKSLVATDVAISVTNE